MKLTEEWKPIQGYEGLYEVSNFGRVKSLRKNRWTQEPETILSCGLCGSGYKFVVLSVNNVHKNKMIHRLVAEAFLQKSDGLNEVNHIDGDKLNNHVSNLEWCTRKHNLKHAVDMGLRYNQCAIIRATDVTTPEGETIKFKSMFDCCKYFGKTKAWLGNYMRKHGNPCLYKGYEIRVYGRGGDVGRG